MPHHLGGHPINDADCRTPAEQLSGPLDRTPGSGYVPRLRRTTADTLLTFEAELLAVADAHLIMPPKSTWFEPKLRSGMLIHTLAFAALTETENEAPNATTLLTFRRC